MNKEPILVLYALLSENKNEVEKIINQGKLNNSIEYHYIYGLINKINECLLNFDKIELLANHHLLNMHKKIVFLTKALLNSKGYFNGYIMFDFLCMEYLDIIMVIEKILKS